MKIRFVDKVFDVTEESREIPFVISKIPDTNPSKKSGEIWNKLKRGSSGNVKRMSSLLEFRIDSMQPNSTIKPPISSRVEMELVILSASSSPKFESVICLSSFGLHEKVELWIVELFFFQYLKITPTTREAKIWEMKSKTPITALRNINIPTVPIIKRGPELFVKLSNLSHSSFVHNLLFLRSQAILAPIGYPLSIPIINAKAPCPRYIK